MEGGAEPAASVGVTEGRGVPTGRNGGQWDQGIGHTPCSRGQLVERALCVVHVQLRKDTGPLVSAVCRGEAAPCVFVLSESRSEASAG